MPADQPWRTVPWLVKCTLMRIDLLVFCDTRCRTMGRRDPKVVRQRVRVRSRFTGIDSPHISGPEPDLRLTPDRSIDEQAQEGCSTC